jgi:hypothetical protein
VLHLRRVLATAAVAVVAGVTTLATAGPASADVFNLHYGAVTGSTHLAKPNVDAAIPTSTVDAQLDTATGALTGTAQITDFQVNIKIAGLIDTSSIVHLVPVGGLVGTQTDTLQATQQFRIQLVRVFSPLAPRINLVPRGCGTKQVSTVVLHNVTPIDLFDTTVSGTYSVPKFSGCGLLTPLLNLLLPGGGNTLTLRLKTS